MTHFDVTLCYIYLYYAMDAYIRVVIVISRVDCCVVGDDDNRILTAYILVARAIDVSVVYNVLLCVCHVSYPVCSQFPVPVLIVPPHTAL